jgi:signal transduction histidine kinase
MEGESVAALVFRTGRPARMGDYEHASGGGAALGQELGLRSSVGAPIVVDQRLWGAMIASSRTDGRLPTDAESRIAAFTELVATAISNAESRAALGRLADEQAALRRVATLVARGAPPEELFAAVTEEAGRLLPVGSAAMGRFDPDGMFTTVAAWSTGAVAFPVGRRWVPEGKNVMTIVFETGRPARIDDFTDASGPVGVAAREAGYRSAVGTPIIVEGRLWGVMTAASAEQRLPAETEARLASFTELVATAISNAESLAELTASRARIVAASDEARRRLERDLHDGAQQLLVSLALRLRGTASAIPNDLGDVRAELTQVGSGVERVLDDLREISRGIHPAILSKGGLAPAIRTLARRSTVPVVLDLGVDERLPEPIEVAAYYVVSEALTNAAKYAAASAVHVDVDANDGALRLTIRDDGVGGADPRKGSGLIGLHDRVEALGGSIDLRSALGEGTLIVVEFPLQPGATMSATRPRDRAGH